MPCVLCCHVTIVCTVCRVFTLTQQYPPYLSVSVEQSLSQTNDCQSQNPYTCPKKNNIIYSRSNQHVPKNMS